MGRAPCCDKANVKRGPWSPEEDSKLKEYIEKHGTGGNWIALPQKAGLKRCGKSCRLRWLNYLRPNIKHGEFSEEEDRIICSLYVNIGSRWSIIAAQLPGRTDNDIKNYWNTKLKKKLMALLPQSHQKIKPPTFPSSNQNQNQNQPPQHSPSSSMYIDYFGSYNNNHNYYTPETTPSSFIINNNTLDDPTTISSLLPPSSGDDYAIIASTISSQPFYQNQDHHNSIMANGGVNYYYNNNNMQYNYYYNHHNPIIRDSMFNMFGSEGGSCSTSSDGSCSHGREIIKQEEMCGYNNNNNDNNNSQSHNMCSYSSSSIINDCGENIIVNQFGQSQTAQVPLDYDVEDIKQLISVSNSSSFNNNIDEIKGEGEDEEEEEKKAMYYYYYYYGV